MAKKDRPVLAFIGPCRSGLCDEILGSRTGRSYGNIFLTKCCHCRAILATCEECDILWPDPVAYAKDPTTDCAAHSDRCPACGSQEFDRATEADVRERGLEGIVEEYR